MVLSSFLDLLSRPKAKGSGRCWLGQVGELGSKVLDSIVRDGFDPVCYVFLVSQSSFDVLLAQDPASLEVMSSMSFKDSLKDAGSSLDPGSSVFEFVDFGVIHSGAAELGERLRLSILEALVSKSFQQYYRKATEG